MRSIWQTLFNRSDRRFSIIAILVFAFIAVTYLSWSWIDRLNDYGGDSAVYVLTAQHFASLGNSNHVAAYFANNSPYPPAYPLVLALFGGADNFLVAHQLNAILLLMSFGVLFYWLLCEGVTKAIALITVIVVAFVSGNYLDVMTLHSEPLFIFCVLLSITAFAKWEKNKQFQFLVIAAAFCSYAILTRSIGVSLFFALCICLFSVKSPKKLFILLVALTPIIIWQFLSPGSKLSYLSIFRDASTVRGIPNLLLEMPQHFNFLFDGLHTNLVGIVGTSNGTSLIAVICAATQTYRLFALKYDAIFVLGYVLILLVWPFPAERVRFVMPLIPILLAQAIISISQFEIYSIKRLHANVLASCFLLICVSTILPSLITNVKLFYKTLPPELEAYRQIAEFYEPTTMEVKLTRLNYEAKLDKGMQLIQTNVPDTECIYSIKPSILSLSSSRLSYATPVNLTNIQDLNNYAANKICNYFFMLPIVSPTYSKPYYPLEPLNNYLEIVQIIKLDDHLNDSPVIGILAMKTENNIQK